MLEAATHIAHDARMHTVPWFAIAHNLFPLQWISDRRLNPVVGERKLIKYAITRKCLN